MQSDVSLSQVNESNVTVELTANVSLLLASCLPADVEECAQVRQVRTGRGGGRGGGGTTTLQSSRVRLKNHSDP